MRACSRCGGELDEIEYGDVCAHCEQQGPGGQLRPATTTGQPLMGAEAMRRLYSLEGRSLTPAVALDLMAAREYRAGYERSRDRLAGAGLLEGFTPAADPAAAGQALDRAYGGRGRRHAN